MSEPPASPKRSSPEAPLAAALTRRTFFKGLGTSAVATAAMGAKGAAEELQKFNTERPFGPEPVPISLRINGTAHELTIEPRVTLLDALRNHLPLTGAKEVCDRGTCGACTVLVDNIPVYACMMLALEAQGREITTIEGIAPAAKDEEPKLSLLQQAFVEEDALMCGFCTPGFVMAVEGLLRRNPKPSEAEVAEACSGNLCRCGTYPRIFEAVRKVAGLPVRQARIEVISSQLETPHGRMA